MNTTASETTPTAEQARIRRQALNESTVWHVFARRKYDEPLHEIGNVMADDVELAQVYARSIYDEFSWIEMVLVPRQSIIKVIEV